MMKKLILFICCALAFSLGNSQVFTESGDFPNTGPGPAYTVSGPTTTVTGSLNTPLDPQDHFQIIIPAGCSITSVSYTMTDLFSLSITGFAQFGTSNQQTLPPLTNGFTQGATGPFPTIGPGTHNCAMVANIAANDVWAMVFNNNCGVSCIDPDVPALTSDMDTLCSGATVNLMAAGNLNDALGWIWYDDSCGGTPVGTGATFAVTPTMTTTYYCRGEGGCVIPGACDSITVVVLQGVNATIDSVQTTYCEADSMVQLAAADSGGTWSGFGIVDSIQGLFDPASVACGNTGSVVYTIAGTCGDTDSKSFTVNCTQDASFSYSTDSICCCHGTMSPSVSGIPSGSYAEASGNLAINANNGEIDLANSNPGGPYSIVYTTPGPCPGMDTFELTVLPAPNVNVTKTPPNILTADETGATYQWLNCSEGHAVISNETDQVFIAAGNASYAVEVTKNGCVDTSECVNIIIPGIAESKENQNLQVFPNPTDDSFTLRFYATGSVKIQLMGVQGKLVIDEEKQGLSGLTTLEYSLRDLETGTYILMLENGATSGLTYIHKR